MRAFLLLLALSLPVYAQQPTPAKKPSPAVRVGGYIKTHKALLAADSIIALGWAADAASSNRCQQIGGARCVEQNPFLGPHPTSGATWRYAMGTASLEIVGEHLIWWQGNKVDPLAGRVLIWPFPIFWGITEFINVRTTVNLIQQFQGTCPEQWCAVVDGKQEARARVMRR